MIDMVKKLFECCEDGDDAVSAASYLSLDAVLDLGRPCLLNSFVADFMGTTNQVGFWLKGSSSSSSSVVVVVVVKLIGMMFGVGSLGWGASRNITRNECDDP